MSETQRAQLLSRWLEQSPGEGVPDDLDDDVVEAVLALRPDLAPAPRLEVMDILDSLTEGPLAGPDAIPSPEEERAAAHFAALLDEGVGDDDDPGLEAFYALRPDLAAPPRVSVFEIVGSLSAGPLADATLSETMPTLPPGTGELPVALEAANTVPPEAGVRPPRRRFWVWLWPGPLALAAAALTLFMVLPVARELPTGFPEPTLARAPAAPAAVSPDVPVLAPTPQAAPLAEVSAEAAGTGSAAPGGGAVATAVPADGLAEAPPPPEAAKEAKPAEPAVMADRELGTERLMDAWDASGDLQGLDQRAAKDVAMDAPSRTTAGLAPATTPTASAPPSTQTRAPAAARSIISRSGPLAGAAPPRPSTTIAEADEVPYASAAAPAAQNQGFSEEDDADGYDTLEDQSGTALSKKETRRDAAERKADREEADASGETPDRRQLSRANRALALGDMDGAEVRYRPLLTSSDHQVVVEASLRLCRIFLAQNRLDEARATVAIGIAAGPEPARLYAELLQISQQLGP